MTWTRGGNRAQFELLGLFLVLGIAVVAVSSCANPVAPSGGPRDETPPTIIETRPERDTVNVSTDTRSVYVEFSEYVERNTLNRALSITPRFEQRIRYNWSGQGVTIELPTSLRDSTTYIFSFDANLTDAHGVSLDNPITVAFSTGPRINQGQIRGRVLGPQQAQPQPQIDVFAYALGSRRSPPPSLPDRPAYRTQTGEDGTFTFDYLREQHYYVVALQDNNRNLRPDLGEPFAIPPRAALGADPDSTSVPVPWLLAQVDTTRPRFQQVEPLSRQRVRLTFSEPVRLATRDPTAWTLRDSLAGRPVAVQTIYRSPARANAVELRTAPMDSTRHTLSLTPNLIADTVGHELVPDTARFRAVARPDTAQTRFQAFVPEDLTPDSAETSLLLPNVQPGVRLNQAPDSSTLQSVVGLQDTTGQEYSYTLSTEDGLTYHVRGQPPIQPGEIVEVTVNQRPIGGPDTTNRRRFRRVTDETLGALEGRAVLSDTTFSTVLSLSTSQLDASTDSLAPTDTLASDSTPLPPVDSLEEGPIVVEIIPTESPLSLDRRQQSVEPGSTFVFQNLPEGSFRFRAYHDRNENGRWDVGLIQPYEPAEPIAWSEGTTDSRPRWTNVIPTPLRVLLLRLETSAASGPAPDTTTADSLGRTNQQGP